MFISDRPNFCDLRTEVGSSVGCKFQDVVSTWTGREGWVWVKDARESMNRSIDSLRVRRNAYRHKGVVARRKAEIIEYYFFLKNIIVSEPEARHLLPVQAGCSFLV